MVAAVLPIQASAQEREPICHFTGSGYQELLVDDVELVDHLAHDEDIYPVPEGGCPRSAAATPVPTAAPTQTPGYGLPTPQPTQDFPIEGPDGEIPPPDDLPPLRPNPRGDGEESAPQTAGSAPDFAQSAPALASARPIHADGLANTGSEVWLIALAGLGLLLCGSGLRLRLR